MKVYTQFDRPETKATPSGTIYLATYQEQINENGQRELVRIGQTNIYEEIQTFAEETKIENILKRAAMGDLSVLQQRDATYIDATTMPKSLMEAQNLVIRMRDEFYKMPVDVRKEFDNDPEKYVSLMGTEEFKNIMAPHNEKIAKIAAEKSAKEYEEKVKKGAKLNYDIANEQKKLEGGAKE